MSQRANPTLIGAFVFGAIIIAIGAALFFGSANLFARKQLFETYFDQTVNGLGVGSNVKYKGVAIGKVTKLQLKFQGAGEAPVVRVLYEINTDNLLNKYGLTLDLGDRKVHDKAVANGLRAKLDFESLISGQLYLALDFYKDANPPVLYPEPNPNIFEIPPQPSDIEAILANLTKAIGNIGSVDFASLANELHGILQSAKVGLDELHLEKLGISLDKAADSISSLANGEQVAGALKSARQSFEQLTATLKNLNPALGDLKPTIDQAKAALLNLQRSTAELDRVLKPDSNLRYQLDSSLSQISAAASAVQGLADFLQRHPNALLFGRKPANPNQP
ncbi:MAG: MCE family protein [Verrucomicrobia bacterium]|nr:MCE family protein [Verrucomicrobiota bacterium]